jgi:hypothetical protein
MRRILIAASLIATALTAGSVALSAQSSARRVIRDRTADDFGRAADDWCRDAGRGNRDRTSCDVREQSLPGITSLDVDTGGNGGIRVRGSSASTSRLRFRIVGRARTESDARDLAADVRITTDGGRVRVSGPRPRDREGWSVDVEIEMPRALPLTLATNNGGIAIDGVAGRTRFETTNGGVALNEVSGDVRGRTVNGGINVDLEGARWDGAGLDVETTNGGIRMRLPARYNAELQAETTNGGLNIDFPITVQGRLSDMRRRIDATIGAGGPRLHLRTVNGGVSIDRR